MHRWLSRAHVIAGVGAVMLGFGMPTVAGAARSATVAGSSCSKLLGLSFDDGVSFFRPQTLRILRAKRVHALFFDNGIRVAANPQLPAFQVREGHFELSHTYSHVHMTQLSTSVLIDEVRRTAATARAAGAPLTFKGIRPPFGEANASTLQTLHSLGYVVFLPPVLRGGGRISTTDYDPSMTAAQIRDAILGNLFDRGIIGLHDGPIDTPAGAATVAALPQIIDGARQLGYCFGVVDHHGQVVPDNSGFPSDPIPGVINPVPYRHLVFPGTPPGPHVTIPSRLTLSATHSPATMSRGQTGATLSLTVANPSGQPTDTSPVSVIDPIPGGLHAVAAAGHGWTCVAMSTTICTRSDVLSPHSSYPPITITVNVANNAAQTLINGPTVQGHGGTWMDVVTDTIHVI